MTEPSTPPRTGLRTLLLVVVLLVVGATFLRTVTEGGFVYDDLELIVRDPDVREEFSLTQTFRPPFWESAYPETGHRIPFYRPLVTTAFHLGWSLSTNEPWGHHAVNLTAHLLATAAVFLLLLHYLRGSHLGATFGALLFGLHYVHVESVAWISGISDVLATMFVLWAWVFLLRYLRTGSIIARSAATGLHLGGLFSKEVAMFFAPSFVLGWLLLGPRDGGRRRWVRAGRVLVAPLIVWYGARVLVFDSWSAGVERTVVSLLDDTAAWRPWAIRPEFVGHYLQLMFDPSGRSPFHVFRPQVPWNDPTLLLHVGLGLATFLLAILFLVFREHRNRAYTLGTWIFLIGLLPVMLKPSVLGQFPVSERYLYFSSFGFVLALSHLLVLVDAKLGRPQRIALSAVAFAFVLGAGFLSYRDSLAYTSERAFYETACERSPNSAVAHVGMGRILVQEAEGLGAIDREATRHKWIEAAGHFARVAHEIDGQRYLVGFYERSSAFLFEVQSMVAAVEFVPADERQSQFLIAEAYAKRYEEWLSDMERAVEENHPDYLDIVRHGRRSPEYLLTKARIEFGLGRSANAISLCQEALRVEDNDVEACTTLAQIHAQSAETATNAEDVLRHRTAAVEYYRRAKRLDPANLDIDVRLASELVESGFLRNLLAKDDETARSMGDAEIEEATRLLQNVLVENPTHAVAAWSLGRLYWQFGQTAQGEEARQQFQRAELLLQGAIRLTRGKLDWLERLATMYMAAGRYYDAQHLLYGYRPARPDDLRLQSLLVQVLVRAWVSGNAQPEVRKQAEQEIVRLRELDANSWLADRAEALLNNGTDVPRMLDAWRRALQLANAHGMHPEAIPDLRREAARWFIHVARETQKHAIANAEGMSPEEFSRAIDLAARFYEEGAQIVHDDPAFDLDWYELATFLMQAGRPTDAGIILERGMGHVNDPDVLARMKELLKATKQ